MDRAARKRFLRIGISLAALSAGVAVFGALGGDSWFTVCVSVLAVFYLLLLTENLRWAYLLGFLYAVLYAAVSFFSKLYAGALFHLLALAPVTLCRFARWNSLPGKIRTLRRSGWLIVLAVAGTLFTGLYFIFAAIGDAQPALDSLNFAVSLITVWLMLRNYRELWYFNLASTVLYIAIWSVQFSRFGTGLSVVAVQSIVAVVNLIGVIKWKKGSEKEPVDIK